MSAGEEGDKELVEHLILTHDYLGEFLANPRVNAAEFRGGFHVRIGDLAIW
jgi:hypothetical protein